MELTRLLVSMLLIIGTVTSTWARFVDQAIEKSEPSSLRRDENARDAEPAVAPAPSTEIPPRKIRAGLTIAIERNMDARGFERMLRRSPGIGINKRRNIRNLRVEEKPVLSERRLDEMLEKAILKIITGDLSTADMLLLKSLNYSLEEVLAIRERELSKNMRVDAEKKIGEEPSYDGEDSLANRLEDYERTTGKRANTGKSSSTRSAKTAGKGRKTSPDPDFDFEAYNRQAVYDYENAANRVTTRQSELEPLELSLDYENLGGGGGDNREPGEIVTASFNPVQESHVVFKIRYDDSEFDSSTSDKILRAFESASEETSAVKSAESTSETPIAPSEYSTTSENAPATTAIFDGIPTLPVARRIGENSSASLEIDDKRRANDTEVTSDNHSSSSTEASKSDSSVTDYSKVETSTLVTSAAGILSQKPEIAEENELREEKTTSSEQPRRKSLYEGLEWVEDDVYRVIPEAIDFLNYYDASVEETENETIGDSRNNETRPLESNNEDENVNNDTIGYQNENPQEETANQTQDDFSSIRNSPNVNLSTYQQFAIAHRREFSSGNITSPFDSQGQKAIEDIKLKVLALTGRFNLSSNGNQVQRERLTMFPPICQLPKNTDSEAWTDPFSMNMNYHLNLTSGDHIVAAKVRIYTLPQENLTVSTGSALNDEEEEEEKKIRISIYFYTKSLKKHRSKKRLTDSIVIPLKSQGSHWALDVRQALRYWRQNSRNSHGLSNNHGLVIQVEDQDGRSLKPSQYIHQDSCHVSDLDDDEKAYQRVPALFIQACSRYVRVVNEEPVTYVNCRRTSRRH